MTASAARAALAPAKAETSFRQRRWIPVALLAADSALVLLALAAAGLVRVLAAPWYPASIGVAHLRGIAFGLLTVPLACAFAGLYPGYGLAPVERLRRRVHAMFFVFAGLMAWGYLVEREEWSRGVLLAAMAIILTGGPLFERMLLGGLIRLGVWGSPVVVFGSAGSGAGIAGNLAGHPMLGYVPVCVLDVDSHVAWTGPKLFAVAQLRLRGRGGDPVRTAVVAIPGMEESRMRALLESLPFPYVIVISDLSRIQSQSITAIDVGGALGLSLKRNLLIPWNRWIKRAIDIAGSALLLALTWPVIAICAIWIRLVSRGPAFYSQDRAGKGNKRIRVWKLRTMYPDADSLLDAFLAARPDRRQEWLTHFKLKDDPRILPVAGRFLRRSSLDELPQLWNIFKGDMSMVGPRPFPEYHMRHFDADFRRLRECVVPGLTGLWQVSARSEANLDTQKLLDTYYIRNWSIWLDIEIAIRTARAVWRGRGAY